MSQLAGMTNVATVLYLLWCTNFTGSTYHCASTSSCVQLFTGVSSARLHHTWSTSASHCPPTLPVDSTYDLPTLTNFVYSVIVARCSAVKPSLLLAQRRGIRCQTTFKIRHCHHVLSEPTENSAALILLAYQRIRGSATVHYINLRLTLTALLALLFTFWYPVLMWIVCIDTVLS